MLDIKSRCVCYVQICACSATKLCLTHCDPKNCGMPGSSVCGISQARVLEWVAISFSRRSSQPSDLICISCVSCIGWWILYHWATREALCSDWSEVAQSCPTLCDPMDCKLPASSVHGIFQARVLEWVAISFSRRSSQPRDWTRVSHIAGRHYTIWGTKEAICTN